MKNKTFMNDGAPVILIKRRDGRHFGAEIDPEDLERVESYPGRWYASIQENGARIYATGRHNGQSVLLHRFLMNPPADMEVDHIDGDGLNNRRANLRVVDRSTNAFNRQGPNSNNGSGIRGVYWHIKKGCYCAQYRFQGKRRDISGFSTPREAEWVRERYIQILKKGPLPAKPRQVVKSLRWQFAREYDS